MSARGRLSGDDQLVCERICNDVDSSKVASVIVAMREYFLELLPAPAKDGDS